MRRLIIRKPGSSPATAYDPQYPLLYRFVYELAVIGVYHKMAHMVEEGCTSNWYICVCFCGEPVVVRDTELYTGRVTHCGSCHYRKQPTLYPDVVVEGHYSMIGDCQRVMYTPVVKGRRLKQRVNSVVLAPCKPVPEVSTPLTVFGDVVLNNSGQVLYRRIGTGLWLDAEKFAINRNYASVDSFK